MPCACCLTQRAQQGGGGGQNFDSNVYRCAACHVDSSGEISFIQHIQGKAHAAKAGRYGFAGLLPNDAGIIPQLSFDPSQQALGPGGGGQMMPPAKQVNMSGGGKKNKAEENIYRCKSCLVDSSGILSYLEHINGKAHIRKAGRIGFSGLLPNGGHATSGSPVHTCPLVLTRMSPEAETPPRTATSTSGSPVCNLPPCAHRLTRRMSAQAQTPPRTAHGACGIAETEVA